MESENEKSPAKKRRIETEDITPVRKRRKSDKGSDDNYRDLSAGESRLPIKNVEIITQVKKKRKSDKRSEHYNTDLNDGEGQLPIKKVENITPVKKKRVSHDKSDDNNSDLRVDNITPIKKKRVSHNRSDDNNSDLRVDNITPIKKKRVSHDKSDDNNSDLRVDNITPIKKKRVSHDRSNDNHLELSDGEDTLPIVKVEDITPLKRRSESDLSNDESQSQINNTEKHIEFSDILQGIDDLNEPACMDRILMYLEEIKDEDYFFMELLVDRLSNEIITWDQPWYQQSNSLSRPLKNAADSKHAQSYRTDTICKAECEKIQENWNEFRKLYDVPDKLKCLARWKNKDKSRLPNTPEERARRFVVAYLARGLQRTLFQVFRHIITYFGGSAKGAYSADEEKIMKVCFMHHPNHSVTLLSMVLGREPRGIYKRLQQLFNGKPEKKKIRWTLTLATRFLMLLLKYTQLPLEDLKDRKIDKSVWLKLEKKFKHHYVYLQSFWYGSLHVQVFVKENIKINKLRKNVFKSLKSSSYQVWTDIRWKDLVKQFNDGLTHRFLYQICRGVVCKIPNYLKKPLSEIADQALDKLQKHQYRKRRLKTLQMNEDGDLQPVRYDSS